MPVNCQFSLNAQQSTLLNCAGLGAFPAFSGVDEARNDPKVIDKADVGPLPPGRYFIVDRQSGGHLGFLWDSLSAIVSSDRQSWFALYRNDGEIDDFTTVNGIRRGNFRLHPMGPLGISQGCITLVSKTDFERLRSYLLGSPKIQVPGSNLQAYGTVDVSAEEP